MCLVSKMQQFQANSQCYSERYWSISALQIDTVIRFDVKLAARASERGNSHACACRVKEELQALTRDREADALRATLELESVKKALEDDFRETQRKSLAQAHLEHQVSTCQLESELDADFQQLLS